MDDDRAFALESRLTNHGCYLQSITVEGGSYELTYQSAAADQHGEIPHQQVGDVVNDFRKLFDQRDWPVRSVEATVTGLDDERLGSWRADAEWFEALEAGEIDEVTFSRRVLDSLERDA
ncbi:hypothetical protein B4589_002275 [Halolamina sp. CBA1230]|uniref:hypothetical protein n=1 Tax=Halolamina sp. CBA1230 TaxID=1853690 RepID=UPI0009A17543|nr:hypothetical protein [Halolamina sp. CBA1230]QKY19257.1 hypothetical protein B4589_002275 [Halolamina sp. CBA1230]